MRAFVVCGLQLLATDYADRFHAAEHVRTERYAVGMRSRAGACNLDLPAKDFVARDLQLSATDYAADDATGPRRRPSADRNRQESCPFRGQLVLRPARARLLLRRDAMSNPPQRYVESPIPNAEGLVQYRAVLGGESADHLYRGVTSPLPIGVVVELDETHPIGTMLTIVIEFPCKELVSTKAVVHWSTEVGTSAHRVGLRFINPSMTIRLALSRVASMFPTRLFDEQCASLQPTTKHAEVSDCPPTARSPALVLAKALHQPNERGTSQSTFDRLWLRTRTATR